MSRALLLRQCLRPTAAPSVVPCQQLFRFTAASRLRSEKGYAAAASTISSGPGLNAKAASRAADLAATEALTDADSAQSPGPKPALPSGHSGSIRGPSQSGSRAKTSVKAKTTQTPHTFRIELSPPKYHVARSRSKNLPIYTDYKRGGNLHLTIIRKITGDTSALRDELRVFLGKNEADVKINSLNGHVVVKGHHSSEIAEFLSARGM